MLRLSLAILFLIPVTLAAQFNYVLDQDITVRDANNNPLTMPWAGGVNAAQHSTLDLDGDGKEDLVIFDRMANKVLTYLNQNNQYQYAPAYEALFPADVTNWILLRDFNCDGKKDLFTGDILGIKVYTNTTVPGENLSWKKFFFYVSADEPKSGVLLSKGFSGLINLQLQYDDLPSITDIDGDGDLDIMNMRYVGEGTAELHKNYSKERYGTCDSLEFERVTQTWGNFKECLCGVFAFNGADCPPPSGGRTQHAGGKSVLAMDIDGDADLDLLFSEATCTTLYLLRNEGTTDAPVIDTFEKFPTDRPANFYLFPATFYEDVDFDGVKDLIATPNIYSKANLNSDLSASNWFYKNRGSNLSPSFTFEKTNFLQDQMIDVGDNSVPAFADYDDDGDLDMFISQNASENYVSTIWLFENTGSPEKPEFKLITSDLFQLSQLVMYNLKIQFADLDSDGGKDLVFTGTNLQTNVTSLYYLPNKKKTSIKSLGGQQPVIIDITMLYAENISVTDVTQDGQQDLLIGKNNGALEYWKNTGSLTFKLQNAQFLGLASSTLRQNPTCAIADLDDDGKADLILGDQSGFLKIVGDFRNATDFSGSVSNIVYNPITQDFEAHNLGGRLWPTVANLFNTNKPVIIVGNILGGVQVLSSDENYSLSEDPVIDLYPNPVAQEMTLYAKMDRNATLQVFSSLGQKINEDVLLSANEIYSYKLSGLARGLYLFRFTVSKKTYTRSVVIY